jgi:hypothetical protein
MEKERTSTPCDPEMLPNAILSVEEFLDLEIPPIRWTPSFPPG